MIYHALNSLGVSLCLKMLKVVCAMVLRDLEVLVDRYLEKMRKSFARMYWDEDYEDYQEETVS